MIRPALARRLGLLLTLTFPLAVVVACSDDEAAPPPPSGDAGPAEAGTDSAPANSDAGADAANDATGLRLGRLTNKSILATSVDGRKLYGWGTNIFRLIRQDLPDHHERPVASDIDGIPGEPLKLVASTNDKACILGESGKMWCWGDTGANDSLGVGDGESRAAATPIAQGEMPEGTKIVAFDVYPYGACVVGDDGEAYCWGDRNRVPSLDGGLHTRVVPERVRRGEIPGEARIVDVSTAINRTCLLAEGRAYCFFNGQPERVDEGELPAGSKLLALRINDDFSCSVADDGDIYCWGSASGRAFGNGSSDFKSSAPYTRVSRKNLPAGVTFKDVAVGGVSSATCGLGTDGWAYCWGSGANGAAGDDDVSDHDVLEPRPVVRGDVPEGVTFVRLGCGTYHCNAEGSDHVIYSWGGNEDGVLAVPRTTSSSGRPVRMSPLEE